MSMADAWIVSNYRFVQHKSLESAEAEAARLRAICPKKQQFRVYRIKPHLLRGTPSVRAELLAALQYARNLTGPDEIIDAALTRANGV